MLLLLFVLLAACGTETGNPGFSGTTPERAIPTLNPPNSDKTMDTAQQIASKICIKLETCYGSLESDACQTSVMAVAGLAPALGFSAHSTLNEVLNDTTKTTNADQLLNCLTEMEALSCSSAVVTSAYVTSSPNDFSAVVNMLNAVTSCGQVGQ